MTAVAYPYLRPHPESIVASEWVILLDGVPHEGHGDDLQHFDYSTHFRASRRIEVDLEGLANQIGHAPETLSLECLVFAGTGGARLDRSRRIVDRQPVDATSRSISIEVGAEGADISRWLTLSTELILAGSGSATSRLAPAVVGARLWRDDRRFSVEPQGPRFPMEVVSFRSVLGEAFADALWFVEWSITDLALDFASAVRLYINADVSEFVERMHEADDLSLRAMTAGIGVQMIRAAVFVDAFELEAASHQPSSLGGVIHDWMERCFPGQSPAAIRTLAEYDPGRFEAAVHGSIGNGNTDE